MSAESVSQAQAEKRSDRGLLVHEWLGTPGGSERVFEHMSRLFPQADIMCLWNDAPESFADRSVRESPLARTPLRRHKGLAVPFMPAAWKVAQPPYDWTLVSTHLFAHHVNVRAKSPDCKKILYVHTPARYIWEPELDSRGSGLAARVMSSILKQLDARMAGDADIVLANSDFVRQRIQRCWGRDARVLHPPVDVARIQATADWTIGLEPDEQKVIDDLPAAFILGASRFIPYKRLDLAIAAGEAANMPVVLAGWGPYEKELRFEAASASVPVTIVSRPSDQLLYALYARAHVYMFPPVEDFGMMPIEAMALGTPVVVNPVGGAQESVMACRGGSFLQSESPAALRTAIKEATAIDRTSIAKNARLFDAATFEGAILDVVGTASPSNDQSTDAKSS